MEYDTPQHIASVLMRHASRHFKSVLEPSVGNGSLIAPLRNRIAANDATVTAVDINSSRLSEVQDRLAGVVVDLVHADFLRWSSGWRRPAFDLIVTNPPFVAKRNAAVEVCAGDEISAGGKGTRRVPIEAAFLLRCIRLLAGGGRLLSVLPSSIISSDRAIWLRKAILSVGSVRYVHELPKGCFPSLEARTYLFVFDKAIDRRCVTLQNHDLARPENLLLPRSEAVLGSRLDFGFRQAGVAMQRLELQSSLRWECIGDVAEVIRGEVESPIVGGEVVHTNWAMPCIWGGGSGNRASGQSTGKRAIRQGDLLMSRVGRSCSATVGASWGNEGRKCSDCVMLIRPKKTADATRILFALRIAVGFEILRSLLERGTGACYVTADALTRFRIPLGVVEGYSREYALYRGASAARDRNTMLRVESEVLRSLLNSIDLPR